MSNETNNTLLLNKNSALIRVHVILCRSIFVKRNRFIKVLNVKKMVIYLHNSHIRNSLQRTLLKSSIQQYYTRSQEEYK